MSFILAYLTIGFFYAVFLKLVLPRSTFLGCMFLWPFSALAAFWYGLLLARSVS